MNRAPASNASVSRRRPQVLAIGEAKHTSSLHTLADAVRLDAARDLVVSTRSGQFETSNINLLLFSAAGFREDVQEVALTRPDLTLIDLDAPYGSTP